MSKKKKIFIGLGVLFGLFVLCIIMGMIIGNTPSGKATSTAQAAGTQTQAAMPTSTPAPTQTPKPTNTSVPSSTPTPEPSPISFEGSGDKILDINKTFDAGILYAEYHGSSNFVITTYDENNEMVSLLVNKIGSYQGYTAVDFFDTDRTARIEVKASGPWKIDLKPLSPDNMHNCTVPGTCEGKGDDVVLLTGGTPDIGTVKYTGNSNFIVTSYGDSFDLLVNEIGSYSGQIMIPNQTKVIVIQSEGTWSIEITEK